MFAILLGLCARSILGLPLALILLSWFFKYAFILFDSTLRGFDEPPVLDINMMNPYGELRPAAMVLIICGMAAVVWAADRHVGLIAAAALAIVLLLALPASVATLGLETNLLQALNPDAWLRMIHGLGVYYGLSLGLIAAEVAVISLLGQLPLGRIFQFAAVMFGTLSAFSLLAGALYERRDQLGLIAWTSPERLEEEQRHEDHLRDETVITEAYGLMRAARHRECWQALQVWLEKQAFAPESYGWLTEKADSWEDPRYARRLSEDWIERLMVLNRTGEGLTVVIERIRREPEFRPRSAADTLGMAQLAARGGGSPRTARILLSDFAQRFPSDPRVAIAAELARHLQ